MITLKDRNICTCMCVNADYKFCFFVVTNRFRPDGWSDVRRKEGGGVVSSDCKNCYPIKSRKHIYISYLLLNCKEIIG